MSTSPIPIVPPGEDELPYSDGEPMESEQHVLQASLLRESLRLAWQGRDDAYVGTNMFVYFSEQQVRKNDFRGPDVFVVLDTVRRVRKSWVVWEENGRTPNVVIELLSSSTEAIDRGEKMDVYAKRLHVAEYFLFDPLTFVLEGYKLDGHRYRRMRADAEGCLPTRELGLRLGLRQGVYQDVDWRWLRWLDAEGKPLPTHEEQLRLERRTRR